MEDIIRVIESIIGNIMQTYLVGYRSIPMKTTPFSGTTPFAFHKNATEMALIDKAASKCDFREFKSCFVQELLGAFDAPLQKPRVRRRSGGPLKRFGEMGARQAT